MKAFVLCLMSFVLVLSASAQGLTRPRTHGSRLQRPSAARPPQTTQTSQTSQTSSSGEVPALNWDAAPVDIVLQAYGERVNKTILKDPQVPQATITLKSQPGQKLTNEEYLEAIETVLEMNQIHLEPYGESFIRALPRAKVRKEGVPLYMDIKDVPEDTKDGAVVSVMLPFKAIATDEAQKALEGLKSDTGLLLVYERSNSILVTDTWQNIKRMGEIAASIDVTSPAMEQVFVYQVANAAAQDIQTHLQKIVEESMKDQEKNGKGAQNVQNQQPRPGLPTGSRLLRSPQQPEAPKNVESLVTSISDADRGVIRGKVVILADERSNKLIIITSKANYDFFEKIIKQLDVETTPDTVVKVYRLKYAEAEEVSDMINDLIGNAPSSKNNTKGNQNAAARGQGGSSRVTSSAAGQTQRKSANQRTGEAKAGELSKDNTTVLADKRINGLVVMTNKELVPVVESIIDSMDVKLSQVLIETAIIEVTLGDDYNTGIDWVMRGKGRESRQATDGYGRKLYWTEEPDDSGRVYMTQTTEDTGVPVMMSQMIRDTFVNNGNYGLGGGGGSGNAILKTMMAVGTNVVNGALFGGANPIGSGINYLLKSDKLNISAVINATKSDSHAKYLASPIVMTVDNKEATVEATEARKFFNGYETSSSYSTYVRTPKYDSKDIGITIKVTPKINPNGTVMLNVEEEYSQLGAGQSILVDDGSTANIDTSLTRKMSADVLLENMQTVVLGGLTERFTSDKETGIPILKDIPWIGKWLFGSVTHAETRKELLVFMTPYVLDDAEATQAEAKRRKSALSDQHAWEDDGWSASELADPVSKRELLRRLKEEARKQDDDRQNKLAIEKWKMDRAKALEKMSEKERRFWIDTHKEELEKEEKKEFERQLKEQEDLKALAENIKSNHMAKAEAALKEADDAAKALIKETESTDALSAEAPKTQAEKEPEKLSADFAVSSAVDSLLLH